ncbi:MAG TPA: DUF2007 domain-containing protein [Hyphomicrobiaceae bacterium]|nr:DUF2007 domain-containing protein [Hyphomicrobiaceae bacterium]
MHTLIATSDLVLISFAEHVLGDAGIDFFVADQHISMTEGSIGAFPRRLLVPADQAEAAREALIEAGLGQELTKAGSAGPGGGGP